MNFNKKNRTKKYFYANVVFELKNIEVKFSNEKIYKNDFSRTINKDNVSPFFGFDEKPEFDLKYETIGNTTLGPGAFLSLYNFNIRTKDEKHQFFGSSLSRGIIYPNLTNKIKIGKTLW